jgi:hypothetical protein
MVGACHCAWVWCGGLEVVICGWLSPCLSSLVWAVVGVVLTIHII